jgi:large subunit ribosomal protein L25
MVTARLREERGKGAARRLRRQDLIPAVLYGGKNGGESLPLTISHKEILKILKHKVGAMAVLQLKLEGVKKRQQRNVIIREIQTHPVRHEILHLDLYEVAMDKLVQVETSIELTGQPVGVKEQGGILEHNLRSLNIKCLPGQIPDHILVDISRLELGKSIHVADLQVPEGVTVLDDKELVVVSVIEKPTEKVPVAEGEAAAEEAAAPTEEQKTQASAPEQKSKE